MENQSATGSRSWTIVKVGYAFKLHAAVKGSLSLEARAQQYRICLPGVLRPYAEPLSTYLVTQTACCQSPTGFFFSALHLC